jgi:hypothetical protein
MMINGDAWLEEDGLLISNKKMIASENLLCSSALSHVSIWVNCSGMAQRPN